MPDWRFEVRHGAYRADLMLPDEETHGADQRELSMLRKHMVDLYWLDR